MTLQQKSLASGNRSPRIFYGWAIVAFTFVVQFISMGTVFYAYSVLLKPLAETLEADRFLVSLALSLQMAVAAVLGPWVGKLVAERSIRALMMAGCGALSLGFLLLSQAQTLWHLYVAFGLILATAMALTGPLPNNALLANWFVKRRGTAFGISQFGVSISGTALVPLTTWLVLDYGWRSAVAVYAAVPVVLLMPLVLLLAVKRPEDMGLLPDGSDVRPAEEPAGAAWTVGRALRDRRIWLLALIVGPSFMSITSVLLALHSHITDIGTSALRASAIVAVTTFLAALAKPLFGTLSDYVDKRLVMGLSLLCQTIGLLIFTFSQSEAGLTVGGVLFGLGYGAVMPLWGVLLGAIFGREDFARIMGAMGPITLPFTLLGLPFTTWVFESTGSYVPAFGALVAGFALSAVALAVLKLPRERAAAAADDAAA